MSEIIVHSSTRPMCDVKGCEMISSFHGFGRDLCWSDYSRFILSFTMYNAEDTKQISFTFDNESK